MYEYPFLICAQCAKNNTCMHKGEVQSIYHDIYKIAEEYEYLDVKVR